jgi:hypothetical protein
MCSPHSLFIALAREPMHDKMLCFVTPDCQHLAERHREKIPAMDGIGRGRERCPDCRAARRASWAGAVRRLADV